MANQDSFINEVTDEVRRDKLFALMRKYGWIAVALVVLVVGGAAVNEWRRAQARAEAEALGDAVLTALAAENAEARAAALAALPPREDAAQRAILGLLSAAAQAEAGDAEAAQATLQAVADDEGAPRIYRDLALLKSVIAGRGVAPEARLERLQPLMQPGNAFRLLAIEQQAFAQIEMGETEAALETLRGIMADAEVTEDLRRRATQLIVALGGTPEQG